MSKRDLTSLVAALGACALFITSCSGKPAAGGTDAAGSSNAATPKATGFKVTDAQRARLQIVTVAPTTFQPTIEVTGTVAFNGDQSTQVLAPISGPVVRLLVNTGSEVTPGQALATVSSPDFAADVATYRKAEEAARNTQRILKLNEQLFQNDALSRSDLDQSRTDAASASADLEAAAQQMRSLGVDDATITAIHDGKQTAPLESAIRAPIAGTIVEKLVNPGQLLSAGTTPTFTIARVGHRVGDGQCVRDRSGVGDSGGTRGHPHRRADQAGHGTCGLCGGSSRSGHQSDRGAAVSEQHGPGAQA